VSAVGPKRTLLELVAAAAIDAETGVETGALRGRGNVAIARLALDRLPRLGGPSPDGVRAGPPGDLAGVSGVLAGRVQLGATLDDLERAYDACKYGRLADRPLVELVLPSVSDPSLAPAGGAVLHAWVQFVPSRPAPGHEDQRSAVERALLRMLEEHDPGFGSSVVHVDVATPADLERRFGLDGGCLDHLEPALDQQLWLRPLLGWHLHSTPIRGLYLSGAGTHPGGGPTGLPGRCAAERLLAGSSRR
jgi:phytoene dehydrogenase-like protein